MGNRAHIPTTFASKSAAASAIIPTSLMIADRHLGSPACTSPKLYSARPLMAHLAEAGKLSSASANIPTP